MKKIKRFFILILILIIGFVAYRIFSKKSPMDYIDDKTKIVIALDGLSSKNIKDLAPIYKYFSPDVDEEQLNKDKKNISKFYVMIDETINIVKPNTVPDLVFIADPGIIRYYIALKEMGQYFVKDGGVYKLKPEYIKMIKDKIAENGQKMPINLDNIYADYSKGLFFLSTNKDAMENYIKKNSKADAKIKEILKGNEDRLYTVILNSKNVIKYGVEYVSMSSRLKKDIVDTNINLYLNDEDYAIFDDQPKTRKMEKYITDDSIYLSIDDFSKIYNSKYLLTAKGTASMFGAMAGIKIEDELKNIDGELLVDIQKQKLMIPLKDIDKVKALIDKVGENTAKAELNENDKILTVDISRVATALEPKAEVKPNISKNQFLYAHFYLQDLKEMGFNTKVESFGTGEIMIKGEGRTISLDIKMTVEELMEVISKYKTNN